MHAMKRLSVSVIVIAVCVAAAAAAPGRVAAVIEVKSISQLEADIASAAAGLQLPAPGDDLTATIAKAINAPGLAGIDRGKPFKAFVLFPATLGQGAPLTALQPGFVVSLPVQADGQAYLSAVAGQYAQTEKIDLLSHFSGPKTPGFGSLPEIYAAPAKGCILAGPDREAVEQIAGMLAKGETDLVKAHSLPGTIRAALDVQAFVPVVEAAMQQAMAAMENAPQMGGGQGPNPAEILKAEMEALLGIMKQTHTYSLGARAAGGVIDIYSGTTPVPGTKLAAVIDGMAPPSALYRSILPQDALLQVVGSGMDAMDVVAEPYADLVGKIYAGMPAPMNQLGPLIKQQMEQLKGLFAGDYAIGVLPDRGQGIGFIQVQAVKDATKAREVSLGMLRDYDKTYGKAMPGISIGLGEPRTHAGVQVFPYDYKIDAAAFAQTAGPASPFPGMFSSFKGEIAFVDKHLLYSLGPPQVMNATIDRVKQGVGTPAMPALFSRLFRQTSVKPVGYHSLSLVKLLKGLLGLLPTVTPQTLAMVPDSDSGIAGYSFRRQDTLVGVMRIGMSEIASVKAGGMVMAGMLMGGAMMGGQPGGRATDPTQACTGQLRLIDAAKEQCVLERNLKPGDPVEEAWIAPFLPGGKMPTCQGGGTYTLNPVGADPVCSVHAKP